MLQQDPEQYLQRGGDDGFAAEDIEALIAERGLAKKNKDFAMADKIRDDLKAQGIVLDDGRGGTSATSGMSINGATPLLTS